MSNFIEISSAYRNRYEYPNPANFQIPVNTALDFTQPDLNSRSNAYPFFNFSGSKFKIDETSTDPMKNFIGYFPKIGLNLEWGKNNVYSAGNGGIPHLPVSDENQGQPAETNSSSCDRYYEGCQAQDESNNQNLNTAIINNYTGVNRACSLQVGLSSWQPDHICRVINVSKGTGDQPFIKILGGENIEEFYTRTYLEDVSIYKKYGFTDRFKYIKKYKSLTRDAYLESGFPENGWSISDRYRNRASLPSVQGFQTNLVDDTTWLYDENGTLCNSGIGAYSNDSSAVLNCKLKLPGTGYSIGPYTTGTSKNETLNTSAPVINVVEVGCKGEVNKFEIVFPGINVSYIQGQVFYLYGGDNNCALEVIQIGQNVDISPAVQEDPKGLVNNLIKQQDVYNNFILYVPVLGPEYQSRINYENKIFVDAALTAAQINFTCNDPPYYKQLPCKLELSQEQKNFKQRPFSSNTSGTSIIEKCMYLSEELVNKLPITFINELKSFGYNSTMFLFMKNSFKLEYLVPIGTDPQLSRPSFKKVGYTEFIHQQDWEIMPNFNVDDNLNYNISTLSTQQASCYEIVLLNLTLPNVTLKSFIGGLISFYPFVYVELQNVGGPNSGAPFIINSNNPNAKNAVFKIPINDVPTPFASKFVKLSGGTNVQNMKFKPNDNLKFRVFFGNGDTYLTEQPDTCPPCVPDPLLQITCMFQIRRI